MSSDNPFFKPAQECKAVGMVGPPGKTFKEDSDPKDDKADNQTQLTKENNKYLRNFLN